MSTSPLPEDRIPVIVGVGEIVDRPKDIAAGLEPLALLEQALRARRSRQRRQSCSARFGSLDIVNFLSWRYRDPEKQLPERLGIKPAHAITARSAARARSAICTRRRKRIARGECSVAAVCGAEAQSTATKAERAGVKLPWTPFAHDVEEPKRGAAFQKPMAVKLGVFRPVTVYPFYEAATSAHWGQTPREAMAESGHLWSTYSEVASRKSQCLAEAALHAGRNHDADAGQPPDRLALYQADGGQSDRQHGRRDPDDVASRRRAPPACPRIA